MIAQFRKTSLIKDWRRQQHRSITFRAYCFLCPLLFTTFITASVTTQTKTVPTGIAFVFSCVSENSLQVANFHR